jgi:Zn-dependent protease with chaperone function
MTRIIRTALLATLAMLSGVSGLLAAEDGRGDKVDGYAEWHLGDCLIADGQKVCPAPGCRLKGKDEAKAFETIPLGYEIKAKGTRQPDGSLLAREIEAKPNGSSMFEGEIRAATDQVEAQARTRGRFSEGEGGDEANVGRLIESGPRVDRVSHIVETLLPPYIEPGAVRVYLIENDEWNAFAMGNYSIYVFTGLLEDMDDDEIAIILGHELVHATHEHSRKQFKRDMWVQLLTLGALGAASTIDDDTNQAIAGLVVLAGTSAYRSGYGRGMEDQADRVGLRYAYEAGYDITKGPRLWNRFATKYGEGNKVANFFFGDHSLAAARAAKLEKEIALNYPEGPKPDGPPRQARREPSGPPAAATAPASPPPLGQTQALAGGTKRTEIRSGMTLDQVRSALGAPAEEVVFGEKTQWTYPAMTIVFENGRVIDVRF